MYKYILLLNPILVIVAFTWIFRRMNYTNTEPSFQVWFSLVLSIIVSIMSVIQAVLLFKKDNIAKHK